MISATATEVPYTTNVSLSDADISLGLYRPGNTSRARIPAANPAQKKSNQGISGTNGDYIGQATRSNPNFIFCVRQKLVALLSGI